MLEDRGHAFDAVLLDLKMPRMDGLALLKWMKGRVALEDIPVIIQTAATTSAEIALGIRAGAYYYLPKPIDLGVLGSVVGAAVRNRGPLQSARKPGGSPFGRAQSDDVGYFHTCKPRKRPMIWR